MSDFSLTTLFILPASNTLPTTGSTANLTANQFGVFKPDYTPATAVTVVDQPYILLAQGRNVTLPGVGTKKSDKIYADSILKWEKVTAFSTAANQITDVSDFTAKCGEDVTISIRLKSFYVDTGYYNGLTKSFTITTPCCDCGDDPCEDVDAEALVDQFVELINAEAGTRNANNVADYVIAERIGSGSGSKLRINGRVLATEPTSADPTAYPLNYDRLYFWVFAYKGPETSQDYAVADTCDPFATVETVQESTYPRGTSKEVTQLEKWYWSYNTAPIAKRLWPNVNFNGAYTTQVVDGTYYDFYLLKFKDPSNNQSWNPISINQDETVLICNPTGQNAGTIAVLTAYLGLPVDETGPTTTTTTTTT